MGHADLGRLKDAAQSPHKTWWPHGTILSRTERDPKDINKKMLQGSKKASITW